GNYDGVFPGPRPRAETLRGLGLPEDGRILLCAGLVRRFKGFDTAVEACRLLGDGYSLVILGAPSDVPYSQELQRLSRDNPRVRLLFELASNQAYSDLHYAADCV